MTKSVARQSRMEAEWPPCRAEWLLSESMQAFRESYRNYRMGHWKGAKGEVFTIYIDGNTTNTSRQLDSSFENEDLIHETSIFRDTEDPDIIRDLQSLEEWRRAYCDFRTGHSKGAQGELTHSVKHVTKDQLRLLPVAALAQCLAAKVLGETAFQVPKPRFHVHLGGGKLGLGLVLPAIVNSGIPYAILQRPSEVWSCIIQSKEELVKVYINDEFVTNLYVIRTKEDLQRCPISKLFYESEHDENWTSQKNVKGLLMLCPYVEQDVLQAADALSCSLGPGLKATLSKLPVNLKPHSGLFRPALYACENDHQAVEAIREVVEDCMYVKPCMVDRICSDRIVKSDSIHIITETYEGEINVCPKFSNSIMPAFQGMNIQFPTTMGAYSYLYNRKFLLVNGTHTTLAFMTLRALKVPPCNAPGEHELLTPDSMSASDQRELHAWTVARCLVLLHTHEVAAIKQTHQISSDETLVKMLWDYATNTIKRFSTVHDTTKRILSGGIVNRFETRLKAIYTTLSAFNRIPLQKAMLRMGNFTSIKEVLAELDKLVTSSSCYVVYGMSPHSQNRSSRIVEEHSQLFKTKR